MQSKRERKQEKRNGKKNGKLKKKLNINELITKLKHFSV
jgi:hypothetical protein